MALEGDLTETRGELQKTTIEKEALEAKFAKIEKRVEVYNSKSILCKLTMRLDRKQQPENGFVG